MARINHILRCNTYATKHGPNSSFVCVSICSVRRRLDPCAAILARHLYGNDEDEEDRAVFPEGTLLLTDDGLTVSNIQTASPSLLKEPIVTISAPNASSRDGAKAENQASS